MAKGVKTGGRQKGSINRVTDEVRRLAGRLLTDKAYRANLQERLRKGAAGPMEPVLWYYAYGKPKEQHEHSGEIRLPTKVIHEYH